MDAIIHRLRWEIKSDNQATAIEAQKEASAVSGSASFLARLEEILTRVIPVDAHVFLEKLELDLGDISKLKTQQSFQKKVIEVFEKSVSNALNETGEETEKAVLKPVFEHHIDVFIKYLKTGSLPNQTPNSIITRQEFVDWFVAEIKNSDQSQKQFLRLLNENKMVQQAVAQWPLNRLFKTLAETLRGQDEGARWFAATDQFLSKLSDKVDQKNDERLRVLAWQFLFGNQTEQQENLAEAQQILANKESLTSPKHRKEIAKMLTRMQAIFPALPKVASPTKPKKQEVRDTILSRNQVDHKTEFAFIRNAGLVLAAAFLPAYFERLGIVKDKKVKNTPKALRALAQLDLGINAQGAADLALYKVLCGVPLEVFALPEEEFSVEDAQEAEDLLSELIKHWSVLKSTKPNSLRSGFFWREGKLSENADRFDLKVEAQGQDILLGHLPWGIGIIKLAWMQKPLHVDWA